MSRVTIALALACLAARGATPSAFERRCIPPGGVAPPSNTPGIATPPRKPRAAGAPALGRRALPPGVPSAAPALGWSSGRIAALGATMELHRGLLAPHLSAAQMNRMVKLTELQSMAEPLAFSNPSLGVKGTIRPIPGDRLQIIVILPLLG